MRSANSNDGRAMIEPRRTGDSRPKLAGFGLKCYHICYLRRSCLQEMAELYGLPDTEHLLVHHVCGGWQG